MQVQETPGQQHRRNCQRLDLLALKTQYYFHVRADGHQIRCLEIYLESKKIKPQVPYVKPVAIITLYAAKTQLFFESLLEDSPICLSRSGNHYQDANAFELFENLYYLEGLPRNSEFRLTALKYEIISH